MSAGQREVLREVLVVDIEDRPDAPGGLARRLVDAARRGPAAFGGYLRVLRRVTGQAVPIRQL